MLEEGSAVFYVLLGSVDLLFRLYLVCLINKMNLGKGKNLDLSFD